MLAPDWLTARPIAHRGYHDVAARRVENTLPAAEAAIAHNFAIECDLQRTADDRVVVFHDDTLDRLTAGTGLVERKSLAELRATSFRDSDAKIPTLEELLDLVDGRVGLVIELKSAFAGDRRLEAATAAILADYAGPAVVMSFDPASMAAMRHLAPALPRGMLGDRFRAEDWPTLTAAQRWTYASFAMAPWVLPSFVSYDVQALPASAPLMLRHFFRIPLLTWTVRTAADRATAKAWADQITFEGFDPDAA
ncbi:MAG TPA: glycerophosphodiester phosphodiesterase family protein [Bauldia sp.]|nr:glycerophosphodiester phosphodiesterase family protein [Bauldia sp.]